MKLLTRELEALRETGMKASESPQAAELVNLQLEKEDKYKNGELNDAEAVRNAWYCTISTTIRLNWFATYSSHVYMYITYMCIYICIYLQQLQMVCMN